MAGLSLITKGMITPIGEGKIIVTPKMPITVTILSPTQLDLSVETNKLDVVVKE